MALSASAGFPAFLREYTLRQAGRTSSDAAHRAKAVPKLSMAKSPEPAHRDGNCSAPPLDQVDGERTAGTGGNWPNATGSFRRPQNESGRSVWQA
jgi:hypothetical protein